MSVVDPKKYETQTFDWGVIKWLVSPDNTPGANITFGQVVLLPGEGHTRHNHPQSEEILYVLSGTGRQMVDDQPPIQVRPGASIYIPADVYHSTLNTGWEPLRLMIVYAPAGPERLLRDIPGCRVLPPGELPT